LLGACGGSDFVAATMEDAGSHEEPDSRPPTNCKEQYIQMATPFRCR
jgi:hypothetical protein